MAVYVTGDTHGNLNRFFGVDYSRLTEKDYVIIAGDAGILFSKNSDRYWHNLSLLKLLAFKVLWVDGNHENHDWIDSLPVSTWNGGKIHKITENCYHLMRGQIYNIDGNTIFTFGGANSIDKDMRVHGLSWWEREIPSFTEENEGLDNLEKVGNKVDYIITHDCPSNILYRINPTYNNYNVTRYLFEIDKNVEFKHWYFGHHHFDKTFDQKHTVLYSELVKLGETITDSD